MRRLNVLILCERTQTTVGAFRILGHNAISVDLQSCTRTAPDNLKQYHYIGDALDFLYTTPPGYWDLIIAHPPCTYLSKAGSNHFKTDPVRWTHLYEAADFFNDLWSLALSRAAYVCFENPVMHKWAKALVRPTPTDNLQPFRFGDPYIKQTLLFTHNLPPLLDTLVCPSYTSWFKRSGNANYRSKSFHGIATAVATQYSTFILNDYATQSSCNLRR